MKVSPSLVGRIVSIQLSYGQYVIGYKAHVKTADKRDLLMGAPIMSTNDKGAGPVVTPILIGCDVLEVTEDSVKVAMDINGNIVHNTIPSELIVNIAEVVEFESDKVPTVTEHIRQPAPKGGLIIP